MPHLKRALSRCFSALTARFATPRLLAIAILITFNLIPYTPAHAATNWVPLASISATSALVTNSLCYTDGTDLLCNGTGPAASVGGSSPTITTGLSGSIVYRDQFGALIANNTFSISSTTGSIGIGAGAPANVGNDGLFVSGTASVGGSMNVGGSNVFFTGTGTRYITWGGTPYVSMAGDTTTKSIFFTTSGTEALRIVSTGFVGIGTSTPGAALDVVGTISSTRAYVSNVTVYGSGMVVGYLSGVVTPASPTLNLAGTNTVLNTPFANGRVCFTNSNATTCTSAMGQFNSNGYFSVSSSTILGSLLGTPSTTLTVSGTIRMADGGEACDTNRLGAVKYTGNEFSFCRNGTAWETLASIVAGTPPVITTGASGSLVYRDGTGNLLASSTLSISSTTGSVGIGAGAPASLGNVGLYVAGAISANSMQTVGSYNFNSTSARSITWQSAANSIIGDSVNKYIAIITNSNEGLRLISTGYVGIGTTTPSTTLQVSGTIRMADSGEACDTNRSGAMKFTGGTFYTCNGTTGWQALGTGGGGSGTTITTGLSGSIVYRDQSGNLISNGLFSISSTTGSVGIGAGAPDTLGNNGLYTSGNIQSNGTLFVGSIEKLTNGYGLIWQDGGSGIVANGTGASSYMFFKTNSNEAMRIVSTGYVGIGTATPSTSLHVVGSVAEQPPLRIDSANAQQLELRGNGLGSNGNGLVISDLSGQSQSGIRSSGRNIELSVRSSGSLYPKVYANENAVGILTTNPSSSLHVLGAIRLGEEISGTYSWGSDTCDSNRAGSIKYSGTTFSTCNGTAWSALGSSGSASATVTTGASGSLVYRDGTGNLLASSNLSISSTTGSVGIGAGSPAGLSPYSLYVDGDLKTSGTVIVGSQLTLAPGTLSVSYRLNQANATHNFRAYNGNYLMTLNSTGNMFVGQSINAINPSTSLQVSGTIRMADGGEACDANRVGAIKYASSEFSFCRNGTAWETLASITSGASTDRITSGTTSVIAYNNTSISLVTAGTERMVINSAGLVGINTPSVSGYQLGVSGSALVRGKLYLYSPNTANIVIGDSYTSGGTGGSNIAIGSAAMQSASGNFSVVIGDNAGKLQNADYSVMLGSTAGYQNTGTKLVAVGEQSGYANTGDYSAFVGYQAGRSNTGLRAVGMGFGAAYYNTGQHLLAMGNYAGQYNTGNYNIALGTGSMQYHSSGVENVALGYQSGLGVSNTSTYARNTLLGAYSGYSLTSGSSNTIIGWNSGAGLTTGSGNIILGAYLSPFSNTGDFQLNIGNAIYGNIGSGTANANKIGINVPSPTTALEVAGTISATALTVNGVAITGSGSSDRITSSTSGVFVSSTGVISLNTNGTNPGYINAAGLTINGVSSTGAISGTTGYFTKAGIGIAKSPLSYVTLNVADNIQIIDSVAGLKSILFSTSGGGVDIGAFNANLYINNSNVASNTILNGLGSGNVGIGTITPNAKLEVGGTISATNFVGDGSLLTNVSSGDRITSGTTSLAFVGTNGFFQISATTAYINNASAADARLAIGANSTANRNAYLDLAGDATYLNYGLRLQRSSGGPNAQSYITNKGSGALNIITEGAGNIQLMTSGTEAMRILPSGNVGIGGIVAGFPLDVSGSGRIGSSSGNANLLINRPAGSTGAVYFTTAASTRWGIITGNGAESGSNVGSDFAINRYTDAGAYADAPIYIPRDTGNVGIGTNFPGAYKLYVSGNAYATGTFSTSDARYKENIQPMSGLLDKVTKLRPVTFTWKKTAFPAKENPGEQVGLIAQEVEKIYPELVKTNSDGYKAVAYDKLGVLLLGAVKDLKARNEALETENAALKTQQLDILHRLDALEKSRAN